MSRKLGEGSSGRNVQSGRRSIAAAVVGVIIGGLAIIGRTVQAAVNGDTDFVRFEVTASLIGAMAAVLLFCAMSTGFFPGQIRGRELRVRFPHDVVVTGRMTVPLLDVFRSGAFFSEANGPLRSPLVTFGITANSSGLSFWAGIRVPRLLGRLSWDEVESIDISTRIAVGSNHPALEIRRTGSEVGIDFRVASGRALGLSLATAEDLRGLVNHLDARRRTQ